MEEWLDGEWLKRRVHGLTEGKLSTMTNRWMIVMNTHTQRDTSIPTHSKL